MNSYQLRMNSNCSRRARLGFEINPHLKKNPKKDPMNDAPLLPPSLSAINYGSYVEDFDVDNYMELLGCGDDLMMYKNANARCLRLEKELRVVEQRVSPTPEVRAR